MIGKTFILKMETEKKKKEKNRLSNELAEESDQFRFLHGACLVNIKGSVGLILAKVDYYTASFVISVFHTTTTAFHSL